MRALDIPGTVMDIRYPKGSIQYPAQSVSFPPRRGKQGSVSKLTTAR